MRHRILALATGALFMAACSGGGSSDLSVGETASTSLALGGIDSLDPLMPSFAGNSVKVCGVRKAVTDQKYPCFDSLNVKDERGCDPTCYKFNEQGELGEFKYGKFELKVFKDLCPSTDYPQADWHFKYTVFADGDCKVPLTYDQVNEPNPYNFVCYNSDDVWDHKYPNQAVEWLEPGENCNEVICLTENSSKAWDFDVCVVESEPLSCFDESDGDRVGAMCPPPPPPEEDKTLRLDCKCFKDEWGHCNCDKQGIRDLPGNCGVYKEDGCDVVCGPEIAAVRYRSFKNTMAEEVLLGVRTLDRAENRVGQQFNWMVPGTYPVTFTYDAMQKKLTTKLDGAPTLVYNLPGKLESMNAFKVIIKKTCAMPGCTVGLKGLTVKSDGGPAVPYGDVWTTTTFSKMGHPDLNLDAGFVITGFVVITGSVTYPADENSVEIVTLDQY